MSEHVHECEYVKHRGQEDLGCTCACGAIHHLADWQTPNVLPDPEGPCAVHVEDEFKTEYRVMVAGGRGGREAGHVYVGTSLEEAKRWLERQQALIASGVNRDEAWIETRTFTEWKRMDT